MRYWLRLTVLALVVAALTLMASLTLAQDEDLPDLPITEDYDYTVREGDTLSEIAALFDVQLSCLLATNDLTPSAGIAVGDTLLISVDCPLYDGILDVEFPRGEAVPTGDVDTTDTDAAADTTTESAGQGGGSQTYVVQPGDTLDVIGQTFNVSVEAIMMVNDVTVRDMVPGLVLTIPSGPAYGMVPAMDGGPGAGGGVRSGDELYVVQRGDTLDTIAQEFDVSVVSLEVYNEIDNPGIILPGTSLVIPGDAPPYGTFPALDTPDFTDGQGGGIAGELYVVQPGDTLDTIAQELNVSVVSLTIVNEITNSRRLFPGTTLLIPDDAPPYGQYPAIIDDDTPGAGGGVAGTIYVMQPFDTIDQVAQELDVSTTCVLSANPQITNTRLVQPGQQILIPDDCPAYGVIPANNTATDTEADG
jgi:LysM repeat protein